MAKTEKRRFGDIGEGIALRYLENQGHILVEHNYWRPWGEIDIVTKKDENFHFVEVKSARIRSNGAVSRESSALGIRPEENMHPAKLKRLHRAVQTYLLEKEVGESVPWQIDLVCVFIDEELKQARVEVMENIVL